MRMQSTVFRHATSRWRVLVLIVGVCTLSAVGVEVGVTQPPAPWPAAARAEVGHPQDCALCDGSHAWVCLRCQGKGQCLVPCKVCGGQRSVPCPVTTCDRGNMACDACGGQGRIHWQSGDTDPCKVCAKRGTHKCPLCKGGHIDCPTCDRAGRYQERCVACLGVGRHPCPRCKPATCDLCRGSHDVRCSHCAGLGSVPTRCEECYDYQTVFCKAKNCVAGLLVCSTCFGTGVARKVFTNSGTAAGASKCTDCGGRGSERCKACKKGVLNCTQPPGKVACEHCDRGKIQCPFCGG